ncbi:hypothetical protein J6590_073814 [Homalodisca vitripennis]|nr:hypothetical protein J6590_073814 [Homalodisca vitripennis]
MNAEALFESSKDMTPHIVILHVTLPPRDPSHCWLHFHVVGEGVVRLHSQRQERIYDRENYIDFRMRLLGEPGKLNKFHPISVYPYLS